MSVWMPPSQHHDFPADFLRFSVTSVLVRLDVKRHLPILFLCSTGPSYPWTCSKIYSILLWGKGFVPLRSKTYPGPALLYLWYHVTWPTRVARINLGKILNTALPFPVFGTSGATEVLNDWPTANRACEWLSGPMWRACSRPPLKIRAKFDRGNFSPIKKKKRKQADRQCRSRVAPRFFKYTVWTGL